MSDEYSVAFNFQCGKLTAEGYAQKMRYVAEREEELEIHPKPGHVPGRLFVYDQQPHPTMTDREIRRRAVAAAKDAYTVEIVGHFPRAIVDEYQFAAAVLSTLPGGDEVRRQCLEFANALAADNG